MRPFRDAPELCNIVWYPAAPTAKTLPFRTSFGSLDWCSFPWAQTGVGEKFGTPRYYNGERPRIGVLGLHQCGTAEDFRLGGVYDTSLPLVEYDNQKLPLCCNAPEVATGGINIGGTAQGFYVADDVASGGVALGGTAVPGREFLDISSGGVVLGGTAEMHIEVRDRATGGIVWGGTAEQLVEVRDRATGGIVWGGSAEQVLVIYDVATGGIVWSGNAGQSIAVTDAATGGVVFGGPAIVWIETLVTARGGVVFGGSGWGSGGQPEGLQADDLAAQPAPAEDRQGFGPPPAFDRKSLARDRFIGAGMMYYHGLDSGQMWSFPDNAEFAISHDSAICTTPGFAVNDVHYPATGSRSWVDLEPINTDDVGCSLVARYAGLDDFVSARWRYLPSLQIDQLEITIVIGGISIAYDLAVSLGTRSSYRLVLAIEADSSSAIVSVQPAGGGTPLAEYTARPAAGIPGPNRTWYGFIAWNVGDRFRDYSAESTSEL